MAGLTDDKGQAMAFRLKTTLLAVATIATAGGIGYSMQYGAGSAAPRAALTLDDISGVEATSSFGAGTPRPVPASPPTPAPPAVPAQAQTADVDDCAIGMTALPAAGAMIDVAVTAPCHAGERVRLFHLGLSVTEVMGEDGTLSTRLPALMETAIVLAEFEDGTGGAATTSVSSLPFYDRVVLQWEGAAGLELHAREFGAPYFGDGHVWSGSDGDLGAAAQGLGGFFVSLGDESLPGARVAEVYSFPTGTAQRTGTITMTVEAEVTADNCNQTVTAQTIQHRIDSEPEVRDLEVQIPACDSIGDFLVLKSLVDDLTIAP